MQAAGGVGGLLSTRNFGTNKDYLPSYDGNGNVTSLVSPNPASGDGFTQVAHYTYNAFGNVISTQDLDGSGAVNENAHRFSTKPEDQETGLNYYGYRYYDPVTGRWPSRDPIEERGGWNLYGMVENALVNHIEYLGLVTILPYSDPEIPIDNAGAGLFENTIESAEFPVYLLLEDGDNWSCDITIDMKIIEKVIGNQGPPQAIIQILDGEVSWECSMKEGYSPCEYEFVITIDIEPHKRDFSRLVQFGAQPDIRVTEDVDFDPFDVFTHTIDVRTNGNSPIEPPSGTSQLEGDNSGWKIDNKPTGDIRGGPSSHSEPVEKAGFELKVSGGGQEDSINSILE